ncbi:N-acetylglucosamine-6-phosphate deacetylase [Chlamydiota bacterium]
MNKDMFLLKGATVIAEEGPSSDTSVLVENTKIKEIIRNHHYKDLSDIPIIEFPSNYYIIPGMIDMHVHGVSGADILDADADTIKEIRNALPAEGTTAFLATIMTAPPELVENVLHSLWEYVSIFQKSFGAEILGVHLEGPFLSPQKSGSQNSDMIAIPDIKLVKKWQKVSGNIIRLITLAPEQKNGLELIRYLKDQGIIASIGHSEANFNQTVEAIKAGAQYATHLFNAMRGINHREPGTITAVLVDDSVYAELIVDGVHVHPCIIKLAYKVKGKQRLVLVTDAIFAKNLDDGTYQWGAEYIDLKDGEARLKNGTLAGGVLKMNSALKNMISFTDCSIADVITMTAENPAKILGVFDKKGSIAEGKDADIVVLDDDYDVVMTICKGQIVYEREGEKNAPRTW